MEIILVRHGQSTANTQNLWQGQSGDADLTSQGQTQAAALGKYLATQFPIIDQVYSSPQTRAFKTAQIIAENLLLSTPHTDERLKEMFYGDWENCNTNELETRYADQFQQWITNPESMTPPAAESLTQVLERGMSFLQEVGSQELTRVVIVSHAMMIRTLLTKLLHHSINDIWHYEIDNTGWTLIDWDKHPQVISLNQTVHLQES